MSRIFYLILVLTVSVSFGRPLSVYDIPVTRDLSGGSLPTRAQYLEQYPESELSVHKILRSFPRRDEGTVGLVVNHGLLQRHEEGFDQYADDLSEEGYEVVIFDIEGGTAEELKELIIDETGESLVGVIMAGELPLAWFEQHDYFGNEDEPDNNRLVEYPIDLFFMDIDGEWDDTSGSGINDYHAGEWEPDIWLGRLPAYNLSRLNEDRIIREYLERIHEYRIGELTLPHRALDYVDDDWKSFAGEWDSDMFLAFGGLIGEADPESTSAVGYSRHLEDGRFEFIQVAVHSSYDSHFFLVDNRHRYDYFRFRHLRDEIEPQVFFYNLFACSAMNIAAGNLCIGALYALQGPYGLGAVGTTKIGSMLFFDDYYSRLASGETFGESLRLWMTDHAHDADRPNWARSWFYGMTHFGDPTLRLEQGLRTGGVSVDDSEFGDDDGNADAGETISVEIGLHNRGETTFENIELYIESNELTIDILDSIIVVDDLRPGEETTFVVSVQSAETITDQHSTSFQIAMEPENDDHWWDRWTLTFRAPKLSMISFTVIEQTGDGDGWVGAGESGSIALVMRNDGGDQMHETGDVVFTSHSDGLILSDSIASLVRVEPGAVENSSAVNYRIGQDIDPSEMMLAHAEFRIGEVQRGQGYFLVSTSAEGRFATDLDEVPSWLRHYPVTAGFNDPWRWGGDAGDRSGGFATGGPDSTDYPPHVDAALELPLTVTGGDVDLTFRHKMDVEADWDAGVVEIDRGDGWVRVEPEGGYNGSSVGIGSYPGGDCWNGNFDWEEIRIPIPGDPGPLRIRFRFASDNNSEGLGWFIDDIGLDSLSQAIKKTPLEVEKFGLVNVYPNPFNSRIIVTYHLPVSTNVTLLLYNIAGRQVIKMRTGRMAKGVNQSIIDELELPSGLYLLRIEAAEMSDQRKLVLLK